jgi:hypothetical protein
MRLVTIAEAERWHGGGIRVWDGEGEDGCQTLGAGGGSWTS